MREDNEDDSNVGSDEDDGYHLDKYEYLEKLPFRLDNRNKRKVTGLDREMEEEFEKGDENVEEEDGGGKKGDDEDDEVGVAKRKGPGRRSKRKKDM